MQQEPVIKIASEEVYKVVTIEGVEVYSPVRGCPQCGGTSIEVAGPVYKPNEDGDVVRAKGVALRCAQCSATWASIFRRRFHVELRGEYSEVWGVDAVNEEEAEELVRRGEGDKFGDEWDGRPTARVTVEGGEFQGGF